MKNTVLLLAALTLLVPCAARAKCITTNDLLNGVLPAPASLSNVGGSVHGAGSGSSYNANYYAQYLTMDNDSKSTNFILAEADTEDGCGCDFKLSDNGATFNTYSVRSASTSTSHASRAPKKWRIYGSNDQSEWTLLTTEENQTNWVLTAGDDYNGTEVRYGETRLYRFPYSSAKYKWIRFRFLENNGDPNYIQVTRIIRYPVTTLATGATAETFAGCEDLVPASTTATRSRYTSTTHSSASSPSDFSQGNETSPFAVETTGRALMKNVADGMANFIYEFGTDDKRIVNGYMIRFANTTYSNGERAPYAWTFSGSDDYNTWTVLDTRDEQIGWEKDERRYYAFENHNAYAYYKIEFTANNGATDNTNYYEIGNLDYYFLPPDDVFFTALDASFSEGVLTISGALTGDSLAAAVSLSMVTNGIPFVLDCGTVQPGGTFSASFPVASGVLCGTLTGIAGSHTNSIVEGPIYIPGADAARTRFVSPNGNDENVGTSLETPMLHIADAVTDLGASGGTVFVLPGTYTETNDFSAVELSAPVAVIGVTGNPADATVTQNATYGYARVFKLTHASALLRGLTITGGKVQNEPKGEGVTAETANKSPFPSVNIVHGGNILMTDGLVENCIISNGDAHRYASLGGNVRIEGGRLSRCVLVGGTATRNYCDGNYEGYGSISATGGVVENCVIRGCAGGFSPIGADGTSKFINCTVVGNTKSDACGGFVILGNDSRVINTVIFGNENKGSQEAAHGNPAPGTCNQYMATMISKKIPSNASAAFINCATDGETAINGTCRLIDATAFADYADGDYSPAPPASPDAPMTPLVNHGTDYATAGGVSDIDLAGNPRVCGPIADIGAYELQYQPTLGTVIIFR